MFRATTENEADVIRLTERLKAVSIGDVVTYEQLSGAIGRDIQGRRYLLERALDRVMSDTGAVFACAYRLGYRRLAVDGIPTLGHAAMRRARRAARKGRNRMNKAISRSNDAPPDIVLQVNRLSAVLGTVEALTKPSAADKVSEDSTAAAPATTAMVARRLLAALA